MPGLSLLNYFVMPFLCLLLTTCSAQATEFGVIFHIDSEDRMNHMLRQISRHHAYNPSIPTRVILIAGAVKPALDGAADSNGGSYSAQIEQLLISGIRIFACENTLSSYNLTTEDLAFGIESVPSGIAEISRLQVRKRWAYIKL